MKRAILIFVSIALTGSIGLFFLFSSFLAKGNNDNVGEETSASLQEPPIQNITFADVNEEYQFVKRFNTVLLKPEEGRFAEGIFGISLDNKGNVFVSDSSNHRIQKFDHNGNFVTAWGSYGYAIYPYEFNMPMDIATDETGNIYVVDRQNYKIKVYDNDGNFIRSIGGLQPPDCLDNDGRTHDALCDSKFTQPLGISVDEIGTIYVTDYKVKKFSNDGRFINAWYLKDDENSAIPEDIVVDRSGYVYVPFEFKRTIQKFYNNGTLLAEWPLRGEYNSSGSNSIGLDVDDDGNVYAATSIAIQKFSPTGTFLREWNINATRIAVNDSDASNFLMYVVMSYGSDDNRIHVYDQDGRLVSEWGAYARTIDVTLPTYPSRIAVMEDVKADNDFLYVKEDGNSHRILAFDKEGNFISVINATDDTIFKPAADENGNIYSTEGSIVKKTSKNGLLLRKWGSFCTLYGYSTGGYQFEGEYKPPGTGCIDPDGLGPLEKADGQFLFPTDIVVDSKGFVYVADGGNARIEKFDSEGKFISKLQVVNASTSGAAFLAIDKHDNIYVATSGIVSSLPLIQKFDSNGTLIAAWGNLCDAVGEIGCIDPDGSSGPLFRGYGQFHGIMGIAVDSSGNNAYIIDTSGGVENAVLIFTRAQ